MWHDGWMMHNWGFGMWFFFLVGLGVIALVLFLVLRNQSPAPEGPAGPADTAMDILKRRYAEGEIDDEEFRRRKEELQSP
jgi:putative membrane protein